MTGAAVNCLSNKTNGCYPITVAGFLSAAGIRGILRFAILSEQSGSKDLRTDFSANLIVMGRFFDIGLRPPLRMTDLMVRCNCSYQLEFV